MKKLMTGNEAVAQGAWEAGCLVASGYPGTPSTEILENLARYDDVYTQWSPNEKVALEVACGVSAAGGRAIATMKVVGLNVAMDPLMTFSYLGVKGGLIVVVADDPGCSSSQTEQDNRLVAQHAKIPMLEPSNSSECKEFMRLGFEISERFCVPVLLRMTTRICHSKSIVTPGSRTAAPVEPYEKSGQFISSPAAARRNHARIEEVMTKLEAYSEECPANYIEWGDKKTGIITSGISYQHAKEVFGENASYLKLGLTHRAPRKMIRDFCAEVDEVYVIEENDPYLENIVKLEGIACTGKDKLPILYELSPQIIRESLLGEVASSAYAIDAVAPPRPPVLCAGCPHRSTFYAVSKHKGAVAANDIGCYTLGSVPPLGVTDIIVDMGAGISAGIGMERAFRLSGQDKKVFGFVGDSTFFHSGITSLLDAVWNKSKMTICILDNDTTAMTGHQETPGTGRTLMGEAAKKVDIETVVRACGVENIRIVDAYDLAAVEKAVQESADEDALSVLIVRQPCALMKEVQKRRAQMKCIVDEAKCKQCKMCLKIGCPAVIDKDGKISIDAPACNGCTLCAQVCPFDAIEKVGE